MKIIKNMNLVRTSYTESSNEELYAIIYCSGRDHDSSIEGPVEKRTAIVLMEEKLQQEKDKFAVEFFKWVKSNFYEFYDDDNFFEFKGYQRKILKGKIFHISGLLPIYKEELANKK